MDNFRMELPIHVATADYLYSEHQQLSVAPNPSNGKFMISSGLEISSVTIYDLQGRMVYEQDIPDQKTSTLNLNLPDGFYIIKCRAEENEYYSKIVIRH